MNKDELYRRMGGTGNPGAYQEQQSGSNDHLAAPFKFLEEKINPHLRGMLKNDVAIAPLHALMSGATQGLHNTAASAANLPLQGLNGLLDTDMHVDPINNQGGINPKYSALHQGGEIAGNIGADAMLYSLLSPLAGGAMASAGVPELAGMPRVLKEALTAISSAYAGGEFAPGGRETSAAIASVVPFLAGATNSGTAKMLSQDAQAIKKSFNPEYKELLAKSGDVPGIRFSNAFHDLIDQKIMTKDLKQVYDTFQKAPNADSAKKLISRIKKEQRSMLKGLPDSGSLEPVALQKYNLLHDAIDDVEGQMAKGFAKGKYPQGMSELAEIDKRYAQEYSPYAFNELDLFNKGKGSAKGVTSAVHGMEEKQNDVYSELLKRYPELYLNRILPSKKGGLIGGALVGGGAGAKSIWDSLQTGDH